ncbi:MAG TPA: Rrf2 family transcriptional regulator [Bacteroidales bacterium]|nr:Rrf2 family transcriptional regulator [Bacteroidales bacterium]
MLSNSCRYGIRAIIYLADRSSEEGKTGIKQIGKDLGLPTPFLGKILQQLAKQKILKSMKGPHGGFSVAIDPQIITLYDIIVAIDGEDIFTDCLMHDGSCRSANKNKKPCPIHDDYAKSRSELIKLFKSKTVYDLVVKANNSKIITI